LYLFSVQVQEKGVQNNASGSGKNEETAFERKFYCRHISVVTVYVTLSIHYWEWRDFLAGNSCY